MGKTKVLDHKIIKLLMSTKREGMDQLVEYLQDSDFFWAPASTKFHGAYMGGLVEHVLGVHEILNECPYVKKLDLELNIGQQSLEITPSALIIPPLLHDLCKVGAYIETKAGAKNPYRATQGRPKGHAKVSIDICRKYIQLTQLETFMIRYHMGPYGLNEFYGDSDWQTGEYPLGPAQDLIADYFPGPEYPARGDHSHDEVMSRQESKAARYGESLMNIWYHNPIVKLMYFADEMATLKTECDAS